MHIYQIVVTLVVVLVILFAVGKIEMESWVRSLINAVMIIVVCLWLLRVLGFGHYLPGLR